MPQVFFNTDTFKPDAFPALTEEMLQAMSTVSAREHPEMGRKINRPWLLYKIPNFLEAFRDGFDGWHLHHITGESVPRSTLVKARLYDGRPWWEFRFMREADHRKIHGDGFGEMYRERFYSAETSMSFANFVKSRLQ